MKFIIEFHHLFHIIGLKMHICLIIFGPYCVHFENSSIYGKLNSVCNFHQYENIVVNFHLKKITYIYLNE